MRKGISWMGSTSLALVLGCGGGGSEGSEQASGETAGESGTGQTAEDEIGTEQGDGNTTTMGDGDGDTNTTTMGDGDGDTNTTTMGDGDGDTMTGSETATTGDGDGDTMTGSETATTGDGDGDTATTGDPCGTTLYSTVRDFQVAHPDFEDFLGVDLGIVQTNLGMDGNPVYAGNPTTPTTSGAANFNQWYNDVPNVNQAFEVPIELTEIQPGLYQYSNSDFFPIDNVGWGNEGNSHNYHFTLELHSSFLYLGGEVFGFEGDDDLWVFVNGKLGIDLGGVHGPMAGQIDMDALANQLGIVPGNTYDLDFFFAERHTVQSNFEITTTIACFEPQ